MLIKGLVLIFVAGLFQGTWALGIKKSEPLRWESLWAPFSLIGMLLIPVLFTRLIIPDFIDIYKSVSPVTLLEPVFFGTLWGIGAVTFGLAIRYIGMSLTYGINMGVASAIGALIPFFLLKELSGMLVLTVLSGTFIMVTGVTIITIAWILVLSGGFIINFGYALFLMIRKKSFIDYKASGAPLAILKVIATAVMWFAAIAIYGQGASAMGALGPVIGWVMFMALALIISNLWGLRTGEWKNLKRPKKYLLIGNLILIL